LKNFVALAPSEFLILLTLQNVNSFYNSLLEALSNRGMAPPVRSVQRCLVICRTDIGAA
jgi:hypothetical protein